MKNMKGIVLAAMLVLSLAVSTADSVAAKTDNGVNAALVARGGGHQCPFGATWEAGRCTFGTTWE